MPVPRGHILIRFLRMVPPYLSNETAALPFARAKGLVEFGSAVYVDPPAGLDASGAQVVDAKASDNDGLPVEVVHKGGGYYVIGEDEDGVEVIVKGKDAALEAAARLAAPPDPDVGDDDPDD